jgi:hypothetical protein
VSGPHPQGAQQFPRLRQSLAPQGRGKLFHEFAAKALEEMHRRTRSRIEVDVALGDPARGAAPGDVDDVCHQPGCDKPARVIPRAPSATRTAAQLVCDDGPPHYSDVVNVPMSEIADLYWIVVKWAFDTHVRRVAPLDVERRLEAIVNATPTRKGGFVERIVTGSWTRCSRRREPVARHRARLEGHVGAPAADRGVLRGLLPAALLRPARDAQLPLDRAGHAARVLRALLEPREATITRDKLPDIEAECPRWPSASTAPSRRRRLEADAGRHCNVLPAPDGLPDPRLRPRRGPHHRRRARAEGRRRSLLVADVVVKQTRKALQAYVEQHGPVPVKDSKGWGYEQTVTKLKPDQEQVQAALALGEDPAKLFRERRGTRFGQITLKPGQERSEDDALAAALKASLEEKG